MKLPRGYTAKAGSRIFLLTCCAAPVALLAGPGAGQSVSDAVPVYKQPGAVSALP